MICICIKLYSFKTLLILIWIPKFNVKYPIKHFYLFNIEGFWFNIQQFLSTWNKNYTIYYYMAANLKEKTILNDCLIA